MSEIPADVKKAARAALSAALRDPRVGFAIKAGMMGGAYEAFMGAFEAAIAAERNRLHPIEAAPRDGRWVVLHGECDGEPKAVAAFWGEGDDWFDSEAASKSVTAYGWEPTCWKPMPGEDT